MKLKLATATTALGISAMLLLAGCSSEGNEPQPSPTSSSASPSPSATPEPGSSGEISSGDITTDMKSSETPPEWTGDFFKNIPAGSWTYNSNDNQSIAVKQGYDSKELKDFAEKLLAEGWNYSVEPTEDATSYVAALVNPASGESVTLVGVSQGAPDGNGGFSGSASSIVYMK